MLQTINNNVSESCSQELKEEPVCVHASRPRYANDVVFLYLFFL